MSDIETSDWSEIAANNIQPAPAGWPSNSSPNIVYSNGREDMGAIKRDWNRRNPTVTSGGSANVQTLTYAQGPVAYVQGQTFTFIPGFNNSGSTSVNVNGLGAKGVYLGGAVLTGGELVTNSVVQIVYDGTNFQILGASAGKASVAGYLPLTGGTVTGPLVGTTIVSINSAAGVARYLLGTTAGSARWQIMLGDGAAESGSNVGSDFKIYRYTDAGASIDAPLSIARSSGALTYGIGGTARFTISAVGQAALGVGIAAASGYGASIAGSGVQFPNYGATIFAWSWSAPSYTGIVNNTSVGTITPVVCDVRLKERIGAVEGDPLDQLNRLELVSYDLPDLVDRDRPARHFGCGFTAQQVEGIVPEAAVMASTPEETMLSLDPLPLLARCVGAIQQLSAKVTELSAKVARLEAGLATASQA